MNIEKFKNIGLVEGAGNASFQENFSVGVSKDNMTSTIEEGAGSTVTLMPSIECIHAGMTKNYTYYSTEKLKGDFALKTGMHSFTHPYNKPILKNHDTSSEPLGRVAEATFVANGMTGANAIVIKPVIKDKEAIEKIQDGRYATVSIGGSTDSLTCSICGVDNIKDSCEHWPGQEYDGQTCYFMVGNITFNECSFVNIPADDKAMVIDMGEESSSDVDEGTSEQDVLEINAAANDIQESVEIGGESTVTEETTPTEELNEEQPPETPSVSEHEDQIANLTEKIAQMEEANRTRDKELVEQLSLSKKIFASAIISLRKTNGSTIPDEVSEQTRLEARTLTSLFDSFVDLVRDLENTKESHPQVRVPQVVNNESLAIPSGNNDIVAPIEEEAPEAKPAIKKDEIILNNLRGNKGKKN